MQDPHPHPTPPAPTTCRREQRGNAYLVTVMVMIIVTLLGLSIGAVTQTEMLIGARERTNQRVFYVAEAGLSIALARFMVQGVQFPSEITWDLDAAYDTGVNLTARISTAPIYPIAFPPCNMCQTLGSSEATGETQMFNVRDAITVRATIEGPGGEVLAQRRLASLVDIQPWTEATAPIGVRASQKDLVEYD